MVFMSAMSILFVSCGITDIESFLIAVLAAYIPRLIFCHLVHARCPKCGGEARQQLGALIGKDISYDKGICPVTEKLYEKEIISTPVCRPPATRADMDDIIQAIKKIIENKDELKRRV